MEHTTILQDLFDHNDWSNERIYETCRDLSDEQLDATKAMGFGSLRNTLFHLLEAEKLWLERWQSKPWRPLEADAKGHSLSSMAQAARETAEERNQLLLQEQEGNYARVVTFQDSQQNSYQFPIGDLAHHVANHGIHHRAQALSFMKDYGVTIPGGLDYLFFKLAEPSCDQPEESLGPVREYGLQISDKPGRAPAFDAARIKRYFEYNDWAMNRILEETSSISEEQLDHDLNMGMGSMRKNLQHMLDAERWWLSNWAQDKAEFPRGEDPRSLAEMTELFRFICLERNAFIFRTECLCSGSNYQCYRGRSDNLLPSHGVLGSTLRARDTPSRAMCEHVASTWRHLWMDRPHRLDSREFVAS